MVQLPMIKGLGIIRPGLLGPGQYTAVMMAARHLRLALALILGLASATKRPRRDDSSDLEQSEPSASATTTTTITTTTTTTTTAPTLTSTGADPATESNGSYLLRRVVQTVGCLFKDAVACSGDFEDPVGRAAILLNIIVAKRNKSSKPVQPLDSDLEPIEQMRNELLLLVQSKRSGGQKIAEAKAGELQFIAAKQLVGSTLHVGKDKYMSEHACATIIAWDKCLGFDEVQLPGMNELLMAAEKTSARFDRSVFVWPTGQSGNGNLYPEERLYAAAVVIMCRRLGVRPVSVFLTTREFGNSLPSTHRNKGVNWRRPTFQVVAMAANMPVDRLDMANACKSLANELGVSEKSGSITKMARHRKPSDKHGSHSAPTLARPAKPLLPKPLTETETLPTVLREDFAETDRLLLIRSLQVAYLLLNQTAADQSQFSNLFFQASMVISQLLKLNDHVLPSDLIKHKPGPYFTPLDLLRVIAEADRRPDLSAVATAGDVMTLAARMIFRHLHLSLPVTLLTKIGKFNAIGSPESYDRQLTVLADHLFHQKIPYILSSSSASAHLYEMTDVILWAAFRVASVQRGSSSEAFVLCTWEMFEKIPIASQYTYFLVPAILRKLFGSTAKSVEAAVLSLISQVAPVSESLGDLQMPRAMPQEPVATPQAAGPSDQAVTAASQVAHGHSEVIADHILFKATVIMRTLFQDFSIPICSLRDIQSMVLTVVPNDLAKAGELTSVNRLAATSQLHTLDVKLKRKNIPFSETDHVTILLDALLALHFLQSGAAFQLASIPRTRMSDISTEDKGSLALLLVAALFKATSVQLIEGSMSTAFSELTSLLVEAVKTLTSE